MNITVKVTVDRSDCVYRAGETAHLALSVLRDDGAPAREGVVHIRVDNFGARVSMERDVDLAKENPVRLTSAQATPSGRTSGC